MHVICPFLYFFEFMIKNLKHKVKYYKNYLFIIHFYKNRMTSAFFIFFNPILLRNISNFIHYLSN